MDATWIPELIFVSIGTSMILAKISDIIGRKLVLLICLGSFTLFSALCGAAQTMDQLIMFRWCQGIGGGGVFALVQLMFLELVPRRKLPAYMSMVTSALALSLVIGPLLGGGITQHGSWRWIFLLNVPAGVLACGALWFTLPKTAWNEPAADLTQDRSWSASLRRLDILGAFLMLGAILLLTTGLQQTAEGYAWDSPIVLGLVVSFAPMAIAFFMWQWYATMRRTNPEPVFPWRLCVNRLRIGMIM
jgi:MFS family permease